MYILTIMFLRNYCKYVYLNVRKTDSFGTRLMKQFKEFDNMLTPEQFLITRNSFGACRSLCGLSIVSQLPTLSHLSQRPGT